MRLRIPKPMYFIAFAGMALFMGSCAKNTTIIYGNGEDNLPETPQKETTLVTFNASVESRNLTRAMSPMKKESRALCTPIKRHRVPPVRKLCLPKDCTSLPLRGIIRKRRV